MHSVEEGKCLIALFRKIQIYNQSAVIIRLQLKKCLIKLPWQVIHLVFQVTLKSDISFVYLIKQELKHINERYTVLTAWIDYFTIILLINCICTVQKLCHLIIKSYKFWELSRCQTVRKHISVHSLCIGKSLCRLNFIARIKVSKKILLCLIITCRYNKRNHIPASEGWINLLLCYCWLTLSRSRSTSRTEAVRTHIGKYTRNNDYGRKYRRYYILCLNCKLTYRRYWRNKILVYRLIHPFAEYHNKTRHQCKYWKKWKYNSLDKNYRKVFTNLKLHECQCQKTWHCGKTARWNLRYSLTERSYGRLSCRKILSFLSISVAQNNRIINCKCKLKHDCNRIRYKWDCSKQKVGSHVKECCCNKCYKQYRNLRIWLGCQKQYNNYDYCCNCRNDLHLAFKISRIIVGNRSWIIHIISCEFVLYLIHCIDTYLILFLTVESDIKQCRRAFVMIFCIIKCNTRNTIDILYHISSFLRSVIWYVG